MLLMMLPIITSEEEKEIVTFQSERVRERERPTIDAPDGTRNRKEKKGKKSEKKNEEQHRIK
jgi:hypothetical protein